MSVPNQQQVAASQPDKILVVEDNPMDLRLIQYALAEQKDWATSVRIAKDGEVAMRCLWPKTSEDDWVPDLVILDLNLPKLPGIEVLRAIRGDQKTRDLAVIILSSSPQDVVRDTVNSTHVKADLCLAKPIDLDRFLELGGTFRDCLNTVQKRHDQN